MLQFQFHSKKNQAVCDWRTACVEEASKSTAFVYVFVTRSTCCPPTCVCGKLIVFSISLLLVAVDCSLVATRHSPARVVYQRGGSTVVLCRRILLVVVHKGCRMPSAVRFEIQVLHLPHVKPPFRQGLPLATVMIPILDGRTIQFAIFKGRIIIIAIIAGAAQGMHEPFVKGRGRPMNERQGWRYIPKIQAPFAQTPLMHGVEGSRLVRASKMVALIRV